MIYVARSNTMKHASEDAKLFCEKYSDYITKVIRTSPITIHLKNGDKILFMSYSVYDNWALGRRNHKII